MGLDFAIVATYVALIAPAIADTRAIAAAASSGGLAVVMVDVPYQGGLFIAVVGGILVGLAADRLRPPRESQSADA